MNRALVVRISWLIRFYCFLIVSIISLIKSVIRDAHQNNSEKSIEKTVI